MLFHAIPSPASSEQIDVRLAPRSRDDPGLLVGGHSVPTGEIHFAQCPRCWAIATGEARRLGVCRECRADYGPLLRGVSPEGCDEPPREIEFEPEQVEAD